MEDTVREDDRFELLLDLVAVLSGEDINPNLVIPQLTDIRFEEEDISALHARVENLSSGHFVPFFPSHDRGTPRDSIKCVAPRDVHD